jgi:hypothetical protein
MRLECFEFTLDAGRVDLVEDSFENITEIITAFIQCLRGLEDLFLMLPHEVDWTEVSGAILNHSNSLQRVVTHSLEEVVDSWSIDGEIPWNPQWENILQSKSLYCFGTSMLPQVLVRPNFDMASNIR